MQSSVHPKYKTKYHVGNWLAANRAVTIVDKAGVVRYHWVAESLGVEPDYAGAAAREGGARLVHQRRHRRRALVHNPSAATRQL